MKKQIREGTSIPNVNDCVDGFCSQGKEKSVFNTGNSYKALLVYPLIMMIKELTCGDSSIRQLKMYDYFILLEPLPQHLRLQTLNYRPESIT